MGSRIQAVFQRDVTYFGVRGLQSKPKLLQDTIARTAVALRGGQDSRIQPGVK